MILSYFPHYQKRRTPVLLVLFNLLFLVLPVIPVYSGGCLVYLQSFVIILSFVQQFFSTWMPSKCNNTCLSLPFWWPNCSHSYVKCLYVVPGYTITMLKKEYLHTVVSCCGLVCLFVGWRYGHSNYILINTLLTYSCNSHGERNV